MTAGRLTVIGLLLAAGLGGAVIYYLQGFHHYQRVDGIETVQIGASDFAVRGYRGLDNPALPLRLRGCFELVEPAEAAAAGPAAVGAAPFEAPAWFDCWDAPAIDGDLAAGRARAIVAEVSGEGAFRMERVIVIYPDGRAFQWRRLAPLS